jgi:O-antigen/teichoic acid export membrane protein
MPATVAEPKFESTESFAARTLWLSAARLIALVLSFVLPFLLARRLSATEFGLYKQAFQILLTGLSLLGLQVSGGLYSFIPRFPEKKAQVAMNAVLFYALVGGAVTLWFTLWPQWVEYVFRDGALLTPVMPWLGVSICLWLVASAFDSLMVADNDVKRASVMWVVVQFCKTGFLLAAAFWSGSLRAMVLAAVAFGVVHCSLFALYLWRRYGKFWQAPDGQLLRLQLANALPFGLGVFVAGWQYDLHNYFVGHYFNAADYGIYSNGCFQMPLLLVLLDAMDTVLMPEIARLDQQGKLHEIVTLWLHSLRTMAFCFIPACVLMFVLRYELIVGLYSEKFAASVPIFAVTLLNTLLLINFTNAVMRPFEDMKFFRTKLNLVLIPVTGVLLYGGVMLFGLVGVMAAVVVARALDVAVTSWVLGKRLGLTAHDLRILTPLWRVALACVPAVLAVAWLRPWLSAFAEQLMHRQIGTLFTLLAGGVIFGSLFLPAAFACGAVSDDEKAWLQKGWNKLAGWRSRWNAA